MLATGAKYRLEENAKISRFESSNYTIANIKENLQFQIR